MMRTRQALFGLSALAAAAGGTACTEQPQLSSTDSVSLEEFKAKIYKEPWEGGRYIIGGDQVVPDGEEGLRRLWEASHGGALAVYTRGGADAKWSDTAKRNITYCISNNFGARKTQVVDAFRQAAEQGWHRFADVKFVHVTAQDGNCTAANQAVVFDVNPVNTQEYLARAFFPGDTRNDRNVLIANEAFDTNQQVPLANVIAHELGHVLGFRHEHVRPEANAQECGENDSEFRALTTYDSASVMHYPQCGNATTQDLSFSTKDAEGVKALYGAPTGGGGGTGGVGAPMAMINFPKDGATVKPNFTLKTSIVDPDGDSVEVEVLVDGDIVASKNKGPFDFALTGLTPGDHVIDVNATDSSGELTTTSVAIKVSASGGTTDPTAGAGTEEIQGGCASTPQSPALLLVIGLVGLLRGRRLGAH